MHSVGARITSEMFFLVFCSSAKIIVFRGGSAQNTVQQNCGAYLSLPQGSRASLLLPGDMFSPGFPNELSHFFLLLLTVPVSGGGPSDGRGFRGRVIEDPNRTCSTRLQSTIEIPSRTCSTRLQCTISWASSSLRHLSVSFLSLLSAIS